MSAEVDRFLHEAMVGASGGLDPEVTERALGDMQRAVAAQFHALARSKYRRRKAEVLATCPKCQVRSRVKVTLPAADPEQVARAAVATAKAGDTLARLGEFLAGRPDARTEDVGRDWLRGLTDEQLRVVQGWVEANANRRGGA